MRDESTEPRTTTKLWLMTEPSQEVYCQIRQSVEPCIEMNCGDVGQEKLHFYRRDAFKPEVLKVKCAKDNLEKGYAYWSHVLWSVENKVEF